MSSLEAKREQFRKYLERCGVIDALSKALIRLYEEANKPDDAVRYVRKYMCESCPDDEQYELLKSDYDQSQKTIAELEEELERFKGSLKRTPSEIALLLDEGFEKLQADEECKSLLKKHLTKDIFDELALARTPAGATLLDIIQAGLQCHRMAIGAFGADKESYDVFKALLDPIILEYHELEDTDNALQKAEEWGDPGAILDLDPDNKYITSTRIRVCRNIEGFPYFAKLSEDQFKEIEETVSGICESLEGEFKGTYQTIKELTPDIQAKMVSKKTLFKKGDPYLDAAGAYRFWPAGRGAFQNPAETFVVWVNEEDHIKIISMAKCGDLGDVYGRLVSGVKIFEENTTFQRHPRYGYLTTNPQYLGTSLKASVFMKLPSLIKDMGKLEDICNSHHLKYEDYSEEGLIYVENKSCLGITEFDAVRELQDGVVDIIKAEEEAEP